MVRSTPKKRILEALGTGKTVSGKAGLVSDSVAHLFLWGQAPIETFPSRRAAQARARSEGNSWCPRDTALSTQNNPAIVVPLALQGPHLVGIWLLAGSGRGQLRVSPCPPV